MAEKGCILVVDNESDELEMMQEVLERIGFDAKTTDNPQQALDLPRFHVNIDGGEGVGALDPGGEVFIEKGVEFDTMATLRRRGHRVSPISCRERGIFGGGQVILRQPENGVLIAGSDPRKDGCALGY